MSLRSQMLKVVCTVELAKGFLVMLTILCVAAVYVLSSTNQGFYERINLKRLHTTWSLLEKRIPLFAAVSGKKESGFTTAFLKNSCTDEFRRKHFMTPYKFCGRTGNRLFVLLTLIATAASTCYTPVIQPKKLAHLEEIFDLSNVKRMDLNKSSFRVDSEPAPATYDVNLTSRINPAYNWTLRGYRQSFKYFDKYKDLVRSSLKIKENIRRDVLQYMNSFLNVQITIGIHIRRGDFTSKGALKFGFSVSDMAFISRAIAYIKNRFRKSICAVFVVSNDMKWCKANIKGDDIHYSPFRDVGRDLYLLTQCNHNIVTSGTFGWMGAWLNESGIVVYDKSYPPPNKTFGRMLNKDDYYPHHWIGL